MIGKSRAEFIFIRFWIIVLNSIAPLCLGYCAFVVLLYGFGRRPPLPLVIELIALAESIFYLCVYTPYRYWLQKDAVHPPAPSRAERRELFRLCNQSIPDYEGYFRKWFLGAESRDIKRDNLKEFYLWSFFNRDGPPGEDNEELEEYVVATEELLGRPVEKGRGSAKCLRLTLDEVSMLHRSLVWYCCVGFVDFLTYITLILHGFHFHRVQFRRFFKLFPLRPQTLLATRTSPAKHVTYWHRPHTSTTRLPMVFLHGIGIGLYPYTNFLNEINSTADGNNPHDQVGIIAIEIMPVSFRLTHHALGREDMCAEIDRILLKHFGPDQKFVLVSHSYGTVLATHLLKTPTIAKRISSTVLIDPVSILLHLPDVAYNFTRRKPQYANEHLLYYFASRDMAVSHTLHRHFFWSENALWKHDIEDRNVTVCLARHDLIVNTAAVGRYLSAPPRLRVLAPGESRSKKEEADNEAALLGVEEWKSRPWTGKGIDIIWFEDLDHAQVFHHKKERIQVVDKVQRYLKDI